MPKELTNMTITEISLVDDPANEDAKVAIFKSKSSGDACACGEKITKGDKVCKKCGAAVKKADDDMDGDGKKDTDNDGDGAVKKINEQLDAIMRNVPAALEECAQLIVEKAAAAGGVPADSVAAINAAASLKEFTMDITQLSKALEDAEAKLATLEKRATDAEGALVAKDQEISVLKGKVTEAATEDEILKSAPESVQKMVAEARASALAAEQEVAKLRDAAEMSEAIAKAKDLKFGDPAQVGPLLLRIAKGKSTDDDAKIVETLFKQAGASINTSELFKSKGDGGGDADPESILKAKAEEIRKADSAMTPEQAYAKALEQHPELYNAYIAKRRAAA